MKSKDSQRLVIDADVFLAAGGEEAPHPTSQICRDFLKTVLTVCHRVVATPEMRAEWTKEATKKKKSRHMLPLTLRWLREMNGRKKILYIQVNADAQLREKLKTVVPSQKECDVVLNDVHLVEAALATDKRIVSLDDKCRNLFDNAAPRIGELRTIAWVNPCKDDETPIPWLENGAPLDPHRLLGQNHPTTE